MKLSKHEIRKLRTLLHDVCVARDNYVCLKCGNEVTLCASHIYPKGQYRKLDRLKIMSLTIDKKPLDYKLIKIDLEQQLKKFE